MYRVCLFREAKRQGGREEGREKTRVVAVVYAGVPFGYDRIQTQPTKKELDENKREKDSCITETGKLTNESGRSPLE